MCKKKYNSFTINPFPYCLLLIVVLHKMLETVMVKIGRKQNPNDLTKHYVSPVPLLEGAHFINLWADDLKEKWKTTLCCEVCSIYCKIVL